jgi:hypothetical protein
VLQVNYMVLVVMVVMVDQRIMVEVAMVEQDQVL